jgi:hypothetical protein
MEPGEAASMPYRLDAAGFLAVAGGFANDSLSLNRL